MRKIIQTAAEERTHHFLYYLFAADRSEHPMPAAHTKNLLELVRNSFSRKRSNQGEPTWKEKN
jgi:hypothetical protein